jgi:hypothetical protein
MVALDELLLCTWIPWVGETALNGLRTKADTPLPSFSRQQAVGQVACGKSRARSCHNIVSDIEFFALFPRHHCTQRFATHLLATLGQINLMERRKVMQPRPTRNVLFLRNAKKWKKSMTLHCTGAQRRFSDLMLRSKSSSTLGQPILNDRKTAFTSRIPEQYRSLLSASVSSFQGSIHSSHHFYQLDHI